MLSAGLLRYQTARFRARGTRHTGESPSGTVARAGRFCSTTSAPSLPLRMLLTTDGSVTTLLEASFRAPVAVETRENAVDEGLLRRTAVLRLASDGRPLLRAVSEIALDCLPPSARAALLDGRQPIGTVLREAELETRRELAPYSAETATAEDAAELGVLPGSPVFERTYRVVSRARRLATITERIPASLFEEAI
jgi:chorismate-pyruvate lyase